MSEGRSGVRVAVKDLIDVAGVPTTAGCRVVADAARPAESDAACLAGLRRAMAVGEARLVGKTNLHELADGITGINDWFGTPVNPLDPSLVPGGSSSGSAAAVGWGEADIAFGSDTGGSIRIPAACCGVSGMKTTWGRVPLSGVWPLAPSLDSVGPMAADVAGVIAGMALLEPGFRPASPPGGPVGRVRLPLAVDPAIEQAIDEALAVSELEVIPVELPGWRDALRAGLDILGAESLAAHGRLVSEHAGDIGADVLDNFAHAARVGRQRLRAAEAYRSKWKARLASVFGDVAALALPSMGGRPPVAAAGAGAAMTVAWTLPVNLAGLPALALPVPGPGLGAVPAGLQLVGPPNGEEMLCGLGLRVESASGRRALGGGHR